MQTYTACLSFLKKIMFMGPTNLFYLTSYENLDQLVPFPKGLYPFINYLTGLYVYIIKYTDFKKLICWFSVFKH